MKTFFVIWVIVSFIVVLVFSMASVIGRFMSMRRRWVRIDPKRSLYL